MQPFSQRQLMITNHSEVKRLTYHTMKDFDFTNKRVLLRGDFNVPLDENGNITDDSRIRQTKPTIDYLLKNNCRIIVMTSLGRPKGKIIDKLKLDKVAVRMAEIYGRDVTKLNDCVGDEVKETVNSMKPGEIILLENLEFRAEEKEKNDKIKNAFAKQIASFGDYYINDGYAKSHRKNASMVVIPKFIPGGVGLLVEKELDAVNKVVKNLRKPYVAIIGGAKADKIESIKKLLTKVDYLIIGGVLANTFLKANGVDIKTSKYDQESVAVAKQIYKTNQNKILLPVDVVVGSSFAENAESKIVNIGEVPNGYLIMDIGPKTAKLYKDKLSEAATVVWCGPIGVFEWPKFANGTKQIAAYLAKSRAFSLIGGGESAEAVRLFGYAAKMGFISTGGGASLQMLEDGELIAVKVLEENYKMFKL